ncbi:MAG: response regulator, partial [Planctomycetaceae bacterium]
MTTVLVVDDSKMDRLKSGRILEKDSDWTVLYATDGNEALEQIELHLPDIVLTDLQMPGMDGLELTNAVKADYPLLPVILITGAGSEEIAVQALQQGAASYVPKKSLGYDLVETVRRVLSAAREEQGQARVLTRLGRWAFTFTLENDASLIPSVVHYAQQAVTEMRICGEMDRLRVGVALEEALLNAYYHGNLEVSSELREQDHRAYYELARRRAQEPPYRDRRIDFDALLTPDAATFTVRDDGPGFDPASLPDATDPANLERPCGRGLLLMQTFM